MVAIEIDLSSCTRLSIGYASHNWVAKFVRSAHHELVFWLLMTPALSHTNLSLKVTGLLNASRKMCLNGDIHTSASRQIGSIGERTPTLLEKLRCDTSYLLVQEVS